MTQPGRISRIDTTRPSLDFVALFADAAERFGVAVADTDLHAQVPRCPGWTAYDLVVHLGNIHAWAATIVETGRSAAQQNDEPRSRRPRVVSEWYAGKAEDLYEVLRAADPGSPCWNFAFDEGVAGFWRRRQLHETTVHTVDLDAAAGRSTAIAPEVAEDGVDEVLRVFLHRMHQRGFPAELTAPLSVVASDTGRAWTLTPRPTPPAPEAVVPQQASGPDRRPVEQGGGPPEDGPPLVVERPHPQADRITAPAELLYRALWKRADTAGLERSGDEERIGAFLASRLTP